VESVEALRAKIKEQTAAQKVAESDAALRDELVEKASENAEFEVPAGMINSETDRMLQEFGQRLQTQGMNLDLYYQFSGQSEEDLRGQMKEEAESRVRVSLTLEAIAEAEKIEATEADIEAELEKMAAQFNMTKEQITGALGGTAVLENDIKIQKTVEFLVENAKITE